MRNLRNDRCKAQKNEEQPDIHWMVTRDTVELKGVFGVLAGGNGKAKGRSFCPILFSSTPVASYLGGPCTGRGGAPGILLAWLDLQIKRPGPGVKMCEERIGLHSEDLYEVQKYTRRDVSA